MYLSRRSISGFSLLEAIVMIAIIATTTNLVFSLMRKPPQRLELEKFTHLLCSTLQTTRTLAISRNSQAFVIFNIQNKSYSSPISNDVAFPNNSYVTINVEHSNSNTLNQTLVLFYPDGSSVGADIHIRMNRLIAFINVSWLTGLTSCQIQ